MRPRKKDPAFLVMAAIAGFGGLLNVCFAIALGVRTAMHGHHYTPFFSIFAIWGLCALAGAYACIATYRLSDATPPPPPRGGRRLEVITGGALPAPPPAPVRVEAGERAA
jgi:hypothetical protein